MAATGRGAGGASRLASRPLSIAAVGHQLVAVQAACDQEPIDAGTRGGGHIGPHRIPDGQHSGPVDRPADEVGGARQGRLVRHAVRLAGPEDRPAHLLVDRGDRAGAGQEIVADMNSQIRIGTYEGQAPRQRLLEQRKVSLGLLHTVAIEAGTDNRVGLGDRRVRSRKTIEEVPVAPTRSDAMKALVSGFGDVALARYRRMKRWRPRPPG